MTCKKNCCTHWLCEYLLGHFKLIYVNLQGAIQGPGEFAEGIALGVKSLLGGTIGGTAGAFSKITGTIGKGIAALTFDDDYQKKRRENLQNRGDAAEGLARSGKGLVMVNDKKCDCFSSNWMSANY